MEVIPVNINLLKWGCLVMYILCNVEASEVLASMEDLKEIYLLEKDLIVRMEYLLKKHDNDIQELKTRFEKYKQEHDYGGNDSNSSVENPTNAFLMARRLNVDLVVFENLLTSVPKEFESAMKEVKEVTEKRNINVEAAGVALLQLQETYQFSAPRIASGRLLLVSGPQLQAEDCFEMGRIAYLESSSHAKGWLYEAISRCNSQDCNQKQEILELIAFLEYSSGNFSGALTLMESLLQLHPEHSRASQNRRILLEEINDVPLTERSGQIYSDPFYGDNDYYRLYQGACRGTIHPSGEITSQLTCRYTSKNNPYLRIGPIKIEELYLDPHVVLYKDIMRDEEIKQVQELAKPCLARALVEGQQVDRNRQSKSCFLAPSVSEVLRRIDQRIELFTGLAVKTSEHLQVAKYGVGGHYGYHYDVPLDSKKAEGVHGKRIATLLIYMNDPTEGGTTAFPLLRLRVAPERASALFWYNLHSNGSLDLRTLHGACPVIAGSKWACNKWFREREQEFRRPCLPQSS